LPRTPPSATRRLPPTHLLNTGARKNRLDLSVGIALGSASQIALFVAPVLVLLSYVMGPTPMDLQFWRAPW
jgi:calcium/proton exchanger cax